MRPELRTALKRTIPVLCGYLFLGIAFGLLLARAGYGAAWALSISLFVYAGSMQFVLVGLLTAGCTLPVAAVTTLLVNSRHLFYGLSFLTRFRDQGWRYPYLVMALTDETYSLLSAGGYPEDQDARAIDFYISLLDHAYWVTGSVIGAVVGQSLTLNLTGIDFSMTALFVVLLIEQLRQRSGRLPALIGLMSSLVFLNILGPDRFLLPSLIATVAALAASRGALTRLTGAAP